MFLLLSVLPERLPVQINKADRRLHQFAEDSPAPPNTHKIARIGGIKNTGTQNPVFHPVCPCLIAEIPAMPLPRYLLSVHFSLSVAVAFVQVALLLPLLKATLGTNAAISNVSPVFAVPFSV